MMESNGGGRVTGIIPLDLSSAAASQPVGIPKGSQGLMVTMQKDGNGNMSGSAVIYLGDPGSFAWGTINATGSNMNIINGPVSGMQDNRTFVTVKPSSGAQGHLLLEFTSEPLKRSASTM